MSGCGFTMDASFVQRLAAEQDVLVGRKRKASSDVWQPHSHLVEDVFLQSAGPSQIHLEGGPERWAGQSQLTPEQGDIRRGFSQQSHGNEQHCDAQIPAAPCMMQQEETSVTCFGGLGRALEGALDIRSICLRDAHQQSPAEQGAKNGWDKTGYPVAQELLSRAPANCPAGSVHDQTPACADHTYPELVVEWSSESLGESSAENMACESSTEMHQRSPRLSVARLQRRVMARHARRKLAEQNRAAHQECLHEIADLRNQVFNLCEEKRTLFKHVFELSSVNLQLMSTVPISVESYSLISFENKMLRKEVVLLRQRLAVR